MEVLYALQGHRLIDIIAAERDFDHARPQHESVVRFVSVAAKWMKDSRRQFTMQAWYGLGSHPRV